MAEPKQFFILSSLNHLALDVYQGATSPGTKIATYYKQDTNNSNQLWYVDVATSTIRSVASNLCMTINGENRLVIDNYDAANVLQIWEICGTIIRQRSNPGQVLEVVNGQLTHGADICLNAFQSTVRQLWKIENKHPSLPDGRRAPSVHLWQHDNNTQGDILMIDGMVPSYGLAKHTYYSMIQWNTGQEGNGYLGIQDHPDGRNFIFSIWDSQQSSDTIEASYIGPGTVVQPFDGEGTGLKSLNFTVGWEANQWQTFVTRNWRSGLKTYFGFWVRQPNLDKWHHLVTMRYPVHSVFFYPSLTACFVEDWLGNDDFYRAASYRNPFKRSLATHSWVPMRQSTFTSTLENAPAQHNTEYGGGLLSPTQLYLATGGHTSPAPGLVSGRTNFNVAMDDIPNFPLIEFSIISAEHNTIVWSVPESSTPQFAYTITNNTTGEVLSASVPERRSAIMTLPVGSTVELMLEDILGRTKRATTTVNN